MVIEYKEFVLILYPQNYIDIRNINWLMHK